MHLMMDFWSQNRELMEDTDKLKLWLIEATHKAKMTPFGEPKVYNYPFPGRDGVALSGIIFLGESSITIHTYPEENFVFLDLFTCRELGEREEEDLRQFVLDSFKVRDVITDLNELTFDRGVDLKTGRVTPARLRDVL